MTTAPLRWCERQIGAALRSSGSFTVDGSPATFAVSWTEGRDRALLTQADKIPIPGRALYRPLTDAQVKTLGAVQDSLY